MSPPPEKSAAVPTRRLRRRWIVLGLCVAAAAASWFLRARVLERLATTLARSQAGLDVRFDALELDGLSRARVHRIDVTARGADGPLRSASITDLEIDVDVRGLWSDTALVLAVRAASAQAVLDLDQIAPSESESQSGPFAWPASWPALHIDEADVEVRAGDLGASLEGARLSLGARPGPAAIEIDAAALTVRRGDVDKPSHPSGAFTLRAALVGERLNVERANWEGVAALYNAHVEPNANGGVDARIELATRMGSAVLDARTRTEDLRVRGRLENVDLAVVLAALDLDPEDFGGAWSARGAFVLPFADPAQWTTDALVVAQSPRIAGHDADVLSGRFRASDLYFDATEVSAQSGENSATAELVRIPRDADLGCEFLARATVMLDADLRDVESVLGDAWDLPADAPPHRVSVHADLADGWIQLEDARAEVGKSFIALQSLRLALDDGPRFVVLDPSTEIALDIRAPDSAELAHLVLPADVADGIGLAGNVNGSVRLRATDEGVFARISLSARAASVRGFAIDELDARASFGAGQLTVERLDVRAGRTSIEAQGGVNVRTRRFDGLEIEADVPELRELGRALGLVADLPLGRARATARLDGPWTAPEGTLRVDAADVRVGDIDAAWVRVSAHGQDGAIVVDELAVMLPAAGTITASGSARYEAGDWLVSIPRLELDALDGSARLTRTADLRIGDGTVEFTEFALAGGEGAVRAAGRIGADELCLDAAVESAWIGRVLRAFGVGLPAGVRLDGRATIALSGLAAGLASDSVDGALDVKLVAQVDDLSDLALPRGFQAAGSGRADLEISGTWRDARGSIAIEAHGLDVRDGTGAPRLTGAELAVRAHLDDAVDIESFELLLPREARVAVTGRVNSPLDLHALTSGALDQIESAPLDMQLVVDAPDLSPLSDAFVILRRTGGSLAANLGVKGTIAEPLIAGDILIQGGAVKLSAALPAISGVEIDIALTGDDVEIRRASGTYGGGRVDLSGTVVGIDGDPALKLALKATSIPIVRSAEMSVRSDLDVTVEGPWDSLALTGTAVLHDARFEQRLDLDRLRTMFASKPGGGGGGALELPSITDPPFAAMRLRLDVHSETPVRVRTPLLRAQVLTRFSIRGTGANPLLDGTLELEGGRIALPASKLDLTRGHIEFDPNDPGRARLDLTAEGRSSGYDVSARVTGTTDDPIIELTSIPPATQEDLTLLLIAGRVPGARGLGVDQERVVGEVASYVARDLAYEWFGDAGESFADRLEMATGGDVSQSGEDTIEVRFRLTGPARGPGRAVYLRGERDVYDRVNMGMRFVLRMQ